MPKIRLDTQAQRLSDCLRSLRDTVTTTPVLLRWDGVEYAAAAYVNGSDAELHYYVLGKAPNAGAQRWVRGCAGRSALHPNHDLVIDSANALASNPSGAYWLIALRPLSLPPDPDLPTRRALVEIVRFLKS